uniref:Uncharacterized protein n=1 Tax=Amphimedon queenslandica TaxID=400682 RepID=A0A1X7URF7_AMPQE
MKARILLIAVFVGVYAVLVSSKCMCPGVCVKDVTEDGECNPGPNNTIGAKDIGPWKCCKELDGGGYFFSPFQGSPGFCQPCDTVAPNNTDITDLEWEGY